MKTVTVLIPCLNEKDYILKCLDSVLSQDYPKEFLEVLVIDGMSTDSTRDLVFDYANKFKEIRVIDNPEKTVPFALNKGLLSSSGDYVIILGVHSVYPSNLISVLQKRLVELNADCVGGVLITRPGCNSIICRAIAIGSSHYFGVGNAYFRTGVKEIRKVDTVPFGFYKREIFERIGFFDTDLVRNQDDEFNARLIKNGGVIYLIPEIEIEYYSRNSLTKMGKMYYQYGLFKPLASKKIGIPATIRQLIPPLFVFGLILGAILSLVSYYLFLPYISILCLYLVISFSISLVESVKCKSAGLLFFLPAVFLLIHSSYGLGYLKGIIQFVLGNKESKSVKVNR